MLKHLKRLYHNLAMKKVPVLQKELEFQVSQSSRQKEMSWKMTSKSLGSLDTHQSLGRNVRASGDVQKTVLRSH